MSGKCVHITGETTTECEDVIDMFEENAEYLQRRLTRKSKKLSDWVHHVLTRSIHTPTECDYFFCDPRQQTGGGRPRDHINTFTYQGQTYSTRIREIDLTNKRGRYLGKIYLMSPRDDDIMHYCGLEELDTPVYTLVLE